MRAACTIALPSGCSLSASAAAAAAALSSQVEELGRMMDRFHTAVDVPAKGAVRRVA